MERIRTARKRAKRTKIFHRIKYDLGLILLALSIGGLIGPYIPRIRMETYYAYLQSKAYLASQPARNASASVAGGGSAVIFSPLVTESGSSINPVDTQFGIVIPKIGVNAKILASINPTKPEEYNKAMAEGIAHASTSFLPDEDGTMYLFSHSTNYDWFVKDLNAVFYLLKNLELKDKIVIFYKDKQYIYIITDKRVVSPMAVSYLVPQKGTKKLILQTCWPPGSTTERLLIFADLTNPTIALQ